MYGFYSCAHLVIRHIQSVEMVNSVRAFPSPDKLNLSEHIHVLIGKLSKTDSLRIVISSQLGSAVVDGVFQRYGAASIEDLSPSDYPEVFSDLYAIEVDTRD